MSDNYIVSVDLGGTKILTALLTKDKQILNTVKYETDISDGEQKLIEIIAKSVNEVIAISEVDKDAVKAVCMGVPGTVNPESGIIGNAPNLGISNFNIKDAMQSYFTYPVLIENDVNLAGLGIKKFELDDNINNMLVVFIGTGIGGALFFGGKLYRGSSFYAGEIGHMRVKGRGYIASKEKSTSFELSASRPAIVSAIENDIRKGKDSTLANTILKGKSVKSRLLFKALASNDEVVTKHVKKACKITGTVLGSVVTLLNIDTIVIGGGVVEAMGDYMLPWIEEAFKVSVLKEPGEIVKIISTKLGDQAPLYGGIALAEEYSKI
ncbi:MAG: ROK family protein [bacterium]